MPVTDPRAKAALNAGAGKLAVATAPRCPPLFSDAARSPLLELPEPTTVASPPSPSSRDRAPTLADATLIGPGCRTAGNRRSDGRLMACVPCDQMVLDARHLLRVRGVPPVVKLSQTTSILTPHISELAP